jgi:hypothetical protein
MDANPQELHKLREIRFDPLHPDANQAHSALLALNNAPGISHLHAESALCLRVVYDVSAVTLQELEHKLMELGFHLDGSLLARLKRSLYYYTEATQRANMGCAKGQHNCTDQVFANRYARLKHGCRDDRPQHWRRYL